MRKGLAALLVVFACGVLLSSCGKEPAEEPLVVYSFCGENGIFSISNGLIVLSSAEQLFCGGNLAGELSDIVDYSMTYYVQSDNEKRTLISNRIIDTTGETLSIAGETGKISGDIFTTSEIDALQNNLYFELKTMDLNG